MVGQGSVAPGGHGWQGAIHGRPNKRQEVTMETVHARRIL